MGLIIPKNNADADTLDATLKVYYDANGWLSNEDLIEKLSNLLLTLSIEIQKKEPQSYTKKTQVPAYFGFIEWEDPKSNQSRRRLTESGKKFYEARKDGNSDEVLRLLIESLKNTTFGRNVVGCDSDSDVEAPNVFIKASLLLGKLNNNEFAFILDLMENQKVEFGDAVSILKLNQLKAISVAPNGNARKWNDPKPITALKNWGFLNNDGSINPILIDKYYDILYNLRTKNNDPVRFVSKSEDSCDKTAASHLQVIYYGSPGTGKSWKVKNEVLSGINDNYIFRTTFHPDSDYASFVGGYKPVTKGEKIIYKFVPQTFTDAYIKAKKNEGEQVYLVIEEINRGNCAQIFGDLFQLLDRKDGVSEYPIKGDADLIKYLNEECDIPECTISLPSNLNIIATMNTSDQSLFPMDSAFKRRWDWKYIPTTPPVNEDRLFHFQDKGLQLGEFEYSWKEFLNAANERILTATRSEDKQLGYWFVKTSDDNKISISDFVSKVVFYLWNDVFKDLGPKECNPFTIEVDGKKSVLSFNSFFEFDIDNKITENIGVLHTFLKNFKLTPDLDKAVRKAQVANNLKGPQE